MSYVYDTLKGKKKLEWAIHELDYEKHKGTDTFTMCKCGRKGCRSVMCVLCWQEEIKRLEEKK